MNPQKEHDNIAPKEQKAKITLRSIIIGLVLMPPSAYWLALVEIKWGVIRATYASLFVNVIVILFLLALINFFIRKLKWVKGLSAAELLVIYVMLSLATAVFGCDMIQALIPVLPHATWFATPENDWTSLFASYLPRWLILTQRSVMEGYYNGESTLWTINHLAGWLPPLIAWFGFIFVLLFIMVCINVIMRKRWLEQEKLTFPIAQFPLELIHQEQFSSFLSNRLMWLGFGIAFFMIGSLGLHKIYPVIPSIGIKTYLNSYFTEKPWSSIGWTPLALFPFVVGLSFFIPLDMSFSLWFFYFLMKVELIVSGYTGRLTFTSGGLYFIEQRTGAMIGLCVMAIWMSRSHLFQICSLRPLCSHIADAMANGRSPSAYGKLPKRLDYSNASMLYRYAVLGVIIGIVLLVAFFHQAGMSLWVALSWLIIYFIISISITKIRAEVGPPMHVIHDVHPETIMIQLIGTHPLGPKNLSALSHVYWLCRAYRQHPMAHQLEGFKMASETETKKLLIVILLATAVGIWVSYWAILDLFYKNGSIHTSWPQDYIGYYTYQRLEQWFYHPLKTDARAALFMGVGFSLTLFLTLMRIRFLWWPLHPVGYALTEHWATGWFWFSIFVAWLSKLMLLRHGGAKAYRKAIPFFMGLILGDYLGRCLWAAVSFATKTPIEIW
jgi:hypothetical protein